MGVACQQNLDVAHFEPELFHGSADNRHSLLVTGVNQDVAVACRDQIGRVVLRPDIVQVVRYAVGRKGLLLLRVHADGTYGEQRAHDRHCHSNHTYLYPTTPGWTRYAGG